MEAGLAERARPASTQSQLPLPKESNAGNWQDVARKVKILPREAVGAFERGFLPSARLLTAEYDCEICPHCGRPVLASMLDSHATACAGRSSAGNRNKVKAETDLAASGESEIEDSESDTSSVTGTSAATGAASKKRRRKVQDVGSVAKRAKTKTTETAGTKSASTTAATTASAAPKTKQKRTAKSKDAKTSVAGAKPPKPAFNPDKQCGVPLPNGQLCQRSLTCKAHSMGAKRQVIGRSAPYDVLLAQYQRANQARQQAAQMSAAHAAAHAADEAAAEHESMPALPPEREVAAVFEGVKRSYCAPLDRRTMLQARSRAHQFRTREMLSHALLPKGISSAGDSVFGRSLVFRPDRPDVLHYMRAPAMQRTIYLARLHQQRQLLQRQSQAQVQNQAQNQTQNQAQRQNRTP